MDLGISTNPTPELYTIKVTIGVLVGAAHHAVDHGKRFSCTNVQPPVMRVVQLLGVDQEISITAA